MKPSLLKPILPYLWTLAPMYAFERLANAYFLSRNPDFYLISGLRIEVFIAVALLGGVAAGAYLKDVRGVMASQGASIVTFFFAVYVLCDPHVCYSSGPYGLEPVRFGFFLGSLAVAGGAMGKRARGGTPGHGWEEVALAVAGFYAVGFYPVVLTFAGARLLQQAAPWPLAAVLFLASAATAFPLAARRGHGWLLVPLGSLALLFFACAWIALAYFGSIWLDSSAMLAGVLAGAATGAFAAGRFFSERWRRAFPSMSSAVAVALVLLMTLVIIPDAVTGVVPSGGGLAFGTPVYAGAYQLAPQGHADGAMVSVSFAGTDPGAIQEGNYLSAGMGIHSPSCCVDGIDYAYRFDVLMFHGGNEALVASGWEACDDNAACGGHSWKVLLYTHETPLSPPGENFTLSMTWRGGSIDWSYSEGGGRSVDFGSYAVPAQEDHGFNTGVSGGVSYSEQKAAYFYQFGIESLYPIGHGGWRAALSCPALLSGSTWSCVGHASSLRGEDSYWKVIWRWGEDYPGVAVTGAGRTVVFGYAPRATESFLALW